MKNIKNFIYLDQERLNSIYSQVFNGTVENVVKMYSDFSSSSHESGIKNDIIDESISNNFSISESKILADYMYTQLEEKIKITDVNSITTANINDLSKSFLIKVSGNAEINDYERMDLLMSRFNEIGNIIAYSLITSKKCNEKEEIDRITAEKALKQDEKNKRINKLVETYAKSNNLTQDELILNNINTIREIFFGKGMDIIISCNSVLYRGILNTNFLRIDRELLRLLYTYKTFNNWTMVGQLTYIPITEISVTKDNKNQENNTIRDSVKGIFKSTYDLEKTFSDTKNFEVYIAPIAIYTEQNLDISNEQ